MSTTTAAPEFSLTVITKGADCVQCGATERALKKKGLEADVHYATLDGSLPENVTIGRELGHMQAPVGIIKDADGTIVDSWAGFNPGKVNEWSAKLPVLEAEPLKLAA